MQSEILKYNISLNNHEENEARLKTVIEKLERKLKGQEERFTEARNPDYDALTKIEDQWRRK